MFDRGPPLFASGLFGVGLVVKAYLLAALGTNRVPKTAGVVPTKPSVAA
jgi:hypothetical protein